MTLHSVRGSESWAAPVGWVSQYRGPARNTGLHDGRERPAGWQQEGGHYLREVSSFSLLPREIRSGGPWDACRGAARSRAYAGSDSRFTDGGAAGTPVRRSGTVRARGERTP